MSPLWEPGAKVVRPMPMPMTIEQAKPGVVSCTEQRFLFDVEVVVGGQADPVDVEGPCLVHVGGGNGDNLDAPVRAQFGDRTSM